MTKSHALASARTALFLALALPLAGCNSSDGASTSVKLDSVEVEPGTISDDMIILDNSDVDGTAIDTSVPVDPSAKANANEGDKADDADTAKDDAEEGAAADPAEGDTPAAKPAAMADDKR